MKLLLLTVLILFGYISHSHSSSLLSVSDFMNQWERSQISKGIKINPLNCVQFAFNESVKNKDNETGDKFKKFAWYIILTGGKWGIDEESSQEKKDELGKVILKGIQDNNPSTGKIKYFELNQAYNFITKQLLTEQRANFHISHHQKYWGGDYSSEIAPLLPPFVLRQLEGTLDLVWDSISFNRPGDYNVEINSANKMSSESPAKFRINFAHIPQINILVAKKFAKEKKIYPSDVSVDFAIYFDSDLNTEHIKEIAFLEEYFRTISLYTDNVENITINVEYIIDSDCFFEDILKLLHSSISHLKNPSQLKNLCITINRSLAMVKNNNKRKNNPQEILDKFSKLKEEISKLGGATFEVLDQSDFLSPEEWEVLKKLKILPFS